MPNATYLNTLKFGHNLLYSVIHWMKVLIKLGSKYLIVNPTSSTILDMNSPLAIYY